MTNLFNFPEVQSFVLPLLVALLVGAMANRFNLAHRGIGMIAGFIVTVLFVNGVELQPLTAARHRECDSNGQRERNLTQTRATVHVEY